MAAIDYRVLIDHLRTSSAYPAFVMIEALAPDTVVLALEAEGDDALSLELTEGEAGAIFDAIGGALRALAVTIHTPEDPRIVALRKLCDDTEIRAGHVFTPSLTTEDIRAALEVTS